MDFRNLSNNQFKYVHSLKQKKYRQKYNKYIIEGWKLVSDLLRNAPSIIDIVITTEHFGQNNASVLTKVDTPIYVSTSKRMEQLSSFKSASPILAVVTMADEQDLPDLSSGRYIFLDKIQDPGNLGTIIRTADWFGMTAILCTPDSVDAFNPKVIQASMGSFFKLPVFRVSVDQLCEQALHLVATDMEGESLEGYAFPRDFVLCFGNEGQGLSSKIKENATSCVTIASQGEESTAESLNIAISASICMYQARQAK